MLVEVEGVDGSGKNTIINGILAADILKGKKVCDVREYWKSGYKTVQESLKPDSPDWFRAAFVPPQSILESSDILILGEPSNSGTGVMIRGIGIHKESIGREAHGTYDSSTLMDLYSLDGLMIGKEIIEPHRHKLILKSRGRASTFVYQLMKAMEEQGEPDINEVVEDIMNRQGVKYALKHRADIMFIQYTKNVEELNTRMDERQRDAMENIDFQRKISPYYTQIKFIRGMTIPEFYRSLGTRVELIDALLPPSEVVQKAVSVLREYIK